MVEKIDLTVEKGMDTQMPEYVSRMITEYTELAYKIEAAENFYNENDGKVTESVSQEDMDWLAQQIICMCAYAQALETRIKLKGYNIRVIKPEDIQDIVDGEKEE